MPNPSWTGHERRAHPRVPFRATARLFTESQIIGDYDVHDLSVGGALAIGTVAPAIGSTFGVWIASTETGTIRVAAQVVRALPHPGGGFALGLKFISPTSKIEAMIQDVVLAELESASKLAGATGTDPQP